MEEMNHAILKPGTLVSPNMDFWLNYHWEYWSIKCNNPSKTWQQTDDKFLLMSIMNEAHNGLVLSDVIYSTSVGQWNNEPAHTRGWFDPLKVRMVKILFGTREVVFIMHDGFSKKILLSEFDNAFKIVSDTTNGGEYHEEGK